MLKRQQITLRSHQIEHIGSVNFISHIIKTWSAHMSALKPENIAMLRFFLIINSTFLYRAINYLIYGVAECVKQILLLLTITYEHVYLMHMSYFTNYWAMKGYCPKHLPNYILTCFIIVFDCLVQSNSRERQPLHGI